MICWSIEARKIPKNSGSRLIEASLVHGFTSEPEKKEVQLHIRYKVTKDKQVVFGNLKSNMGICV